MLQSKKAPVAGELQMSSDCSEHDAGDDRILESPGGLVRRYGLHPAGRQSRVGPEIFEGQHCGRCRICPSTVFSSLTSEFLQRQKY